MECCGMKHYMVNWCELLVLMQLQKLTTCFSGTNAYTSHVNLHTKKVCTIISFEKINRLTNLHKFCKKRKKRKKKERKRKSNRLESRRIKIVSSFLGMHSLIIHFDELITIYLHKQQSSLYSWLLRYHNAPLNLRFHQTSTIRNKGKGGNTVTT